MMNKNSNYINHTLWMLLLVLPCIIALSAIPEEWTNKYGLRHMDIFSDIRKTSDSTELALSLPLPTIASFVDTCRQDLTCFEDFTENGTGMKSFFEALNGIDSLNRPVRIAFFGDSYIEGDILTSDLRTLLQDRFGGCGVGFVGATSISAGFRQTVTHKSSAWRSFSLVDTVHKDYSKMGMAGSYFIPNNNAWVQYHGVKKPHLDAFPRARVLYSLKSGKVQLSTKVNGGAAHTHTLTASNSIQEYVIQDSMASLQLTFGAADQFQVFGTWLEDSKGISVDNLSLRAMPGTALNTIPAKTLQQFDSILSYDLIVLEYGLNAMMPKTTNYTSYAEKMVKVVNHLKENFPHTSILLLGVGDRSMKSGGAYITMPGVKAMIEYQKSVCSETGIVFWNMFSGMGGEGSMVQMVNDKPAKANKDYTHLNFAGGKHLAEILFKTLMYEKEKYDRRQKHQAGN